MPFTQPPSLAHDQRRVRLLADWRAAEWRVGEAWDVWRTASDADRARAHALYVSALAEEEIAAARLEHEVLACTGSPIGS
jgi:hypothetical protein